jgi:hypothetical protein
MSQQPSEGCSQYLLDGSALRALARRSDLRGAVQGTVNLTAVVSRLTGKGDGDLHHSGNAADFCPDLECLRPGGSVLGGSEVIAAEVKKVVDLIVG